MRKRHLAMGWVMSCALAGMTTMAQATMVAQWTFLDTNDASTEDADNNMLTLTPGGGTAELLTTGVYESGVLHTDAGGRADVDRTNEISFSGDDTLTIWARIKIAGTGSEVYYLIDNRDGGEGHFLRLEDSASHPLRFQSGWTSITSGLNVGSDWHNVAIRVYKDEGVQKFDFYLDGDSSRYNGTLAGGNGLGTYKIGMSGAGLYIEEMRVYDTALSNAELDAIEYVVPEPATLGLLTFGGLSVLLRRKKR
jgi:hypothetical protein